MSKISVRVVEGKCQGGYRKIGDTFEIDYDDPVTPPGNLNLRLQRDASLYHDFTEQWRIPMGRNENRDDDQMPRPQRHHPIETYKRKILS